MPTDPMPDAPPTAGLDAGEMLAPAPLDGLQGRPTDDGSGAADPSFPGGTRTGPALVERAKGALMLRYGVDSHQASALLLSWARASRTSVPTIAHTLLRGICEGNPQIEVRQRALTRWLEAQLRDGGPGFTVAPTTPVPRGPASMTPRSD